MSRCKPVSWLGVKWVPVISSFIGPLSSNVGVVCIYYRIPPSAGWKMWSHSGLRFIGQRPGDHSTIFTMPVIFHTQVYMFDVILKLTNILPIRLSSLLIIQAAVGRMVVVQWGALTVVPIRTSTWSPDDRRVRNDARKIKELFVMVKIIWLFLDDSLYI